MATVAEGQALQEYFPHRGLNVLVDRLHTYPETEREAHGGEWAQGELAIEAGDPAGRDLFLRQAAGGKVIIETVMAEHLALVSLGSLKEVFSTYGTAFFSTISDFVMKAPAPAGARLKSAVTQVRARGPFFGYRGVISAGDVEICTSSVMAYYAHPDLGTRSSASEGDKKTGPAPAQEEDTPVDMALFAWKRPEMTFISRRVQFDPQTRTAVFAYTYPEDHPHVPGHFPDGAVMMGIAQWTGMADALHATAQALPGGAPETVTGTGAVVRGDGTIVCEIRKLTLNYPEPGMPHLVATKKIGFRDMVKPGEEIFTCITLEA